MISGAPRAQGASRIVPSLPPCLQAAACSPKPRWPEMLSIPFPSARRPLVPLGRCRGCQPVQLGVRCGTAVPQLGGTPSTSPRGRARAAESGSPRGFTKLLRSPGGGSIPKCLPAAVFSTITAPAKGSLGWRPSRPEHRLSHSHSCPQCPVQGPAGLLCTGTGHDDTDFYVIPREPVWFQTQALDHLICIFRHSRVPG